jgi:hypothetical protein
VTRSISYGAIIAVSFFAASLTNGQVKQKSQGIGFNAPEMNGGASPQQLPSQISSADGAVQTAGGTIVPISQPDADYVARTTQFMVTVPDFTSIPSLTDAESGCTVTFAPPLQARTVPGSWATWGSPPDTEGSTGRVLYSQGATSITLTFTGCTPTTAGFEAEPNPFADHSMTATFYSGPTSQGAITRIVSGSAGARLFAADGSFDRIVFNSTADFAIARVRFGQGVQAVLTGQVTDSATTAGIEGARVQAVGAVTRSTTTNAMGNYRLLLPEDTYDVTASAFGYASATVTGVTVSIAAKTTQDFALVATARHQVSGTVTTANGTPVVGAQVTILNTPIPSTTTDAMGNYIFASVPDGTYDIRAGGGGCLGSQTQTVTFVADIVVDFTIPLRSDTFGHTCSDGVPFEWMPGDVLSPLVGDDVTLTIPLPFTFNFYGTNYTNVTVSTNGNAHFGPPDSSYVSVCLPSTTAIRGLVGGFWDDLYVGTPGGAGNIYTKVDTDPATGLGIFIIEWRDVAFFGGGPTDRITFEIILREGTNNITFQYNRTDGRGDGRLAVIGIQNLAGTDGLQYSCRTPSASVGKRIDFFSPP